MLSVGLFGPEVIRCPLLLPNSRAKGENRSGNSASLIGFSIRTSTTVFLTPVYLMIQQSYKYDVELEGSRKKLEIF